MGVVRARERRAPSVGRSEVEELVREVVASDAAGVQFDILVCKGALIR